MVQKASRKSPAYPDALPRCGRAALLSLMSSLPRGSGPPYTYDEPPTPEPLVRSLSGSASGSVMLRRTGLCSGSSWRRQRGRTADNPAGAATPVDAGSARHSSPSLSLPYSSSSSSGSASVSPVLWPVVPGGVEDGQPPNCRACEVSDTSITTLVEQFAAQVSPSKKQALPCPSGCAGHPGPAAGVRFPPVCMEGPADQPTSVGP